jgi:uncharacterized protein Yka (UPF0111/DUF47 family)
MFGFLKSSPEKRLIRQYESLMKEAYKLSHYNRRLSDEKYAEADRTMRKIEQLEQERKVK